MKPLFIYDRDNLNQVLKWPHFTDLLKQHGYQKKSDFLAELQKKALHSVLITGLPGSGKTSFAMKQFGANALTEKDLPQLFHVDEYEMLFTKCEPDTQIAASVAKIIHLQVAPERLLKQRALRNQQIKEGIDETGFGRVPGTTDFLTTDDDKIISQLKTDFAEKSQVFRYISPNPENFEEMEELSIARDFDESWLYKKEGICFGIGKIVIPHRGHQAYCDTIQNIGKKHWLRPALFIAPSPVDSYDIGMSQREKEQCMRTLYPPHQLAIFHWGYQPFLQFDKRDFVKVLPELSVAVLAKDRLPADFQGSYAELCAQYPEFMQTTGKRETNSVVKNLHSHRINHFIAGDTLCTDDGVEMSATRVRKALVEKNTAQLQQLLDPKLYQVLVTTENLERMERRYRLAQERKEKLMSNTDQQLSLKTTLAQQKTLNPLTGTPLPIEKGKQKQVNKVFLKKKEYSDADKAVIETYLTEIEAQYQQNLQALTQEKKQLENTYKERIRSKENRLQFST